MQPLFHYAAPPLLGAFIGYTTSYMAIRMLFRPLTPWSILGLRLPLTPGIIPSKRHELAKNIGEMVGDHLLTGPEIRKALSEDHFRNELKRTIDARVSHLLNLQLGPIASLVPERYRSYFKVGIKILRWRFLKLLHNNIKSEKLAIKLAENVAEQINDAATPFTATDILDALQSPQGKRTLDHLITELAEEQIFIQPVGTLADFLPLELRNSIGDHVLQVMSDVLVREIPAVLDSLNIRQVVTRKIDSLNLLRLEELLMGIMQDRFKYINLFGGLLGFLIGLLSLLLRRIC